MFEYIVIFFFGWLAGDQFGPLKDVLPKFIGWVQSTIESFTNGGGGDPPSAA